MPLDLNRPVNVAPLVVVGALASGGVARMRGGFSFALSASRCRGIGSWGADRSFTRTLQSDPYREL